MSKKTIMKYLIGFLLLLLILAIGNSLFYQFNNRPTVEVSKKVGSDKMVHEYNNEASEINANGIRTKMCDEISVEFKQLVKKQVCVFE